MRRLRNIIEIDEDLCNGCGQCILECAEGALELVDGKAKLVGEIYCDGLGACLQGCPTGALTVIQREADEFDEEAVDELLKSQGREPLADHAAQTGAPGQPLEMPHIGGCPSQEATTLQPATSPEPETEGVSSQLGHWPIQLQLISPQSPFLKDADLVLLADCSAVALAGLHPQLLPGRAIAMACPKLDQPEPHIERLADILANSGLRSVTVVMMEVPCCKGLMWILEQAMARAGVELPVGLMVVSREGKVLERRDIPWEEAA